MRQHKTHWPDDVRSGLEQDFALTEGLAHQTELPIFKVAQATVYQLARPRAGCFCKVPLLAQQNFQPAPRRVPCNPRTVDTPANHGKIDKTVVTHRPNPGLDAGLLCPLGDARVAALRLD